MIPEGCDRELTLKGLEELIPEDELTKEIDTAGVKEEIKLEQKEAVKIFTPPAEEKENFDSLLNDIPVIPIEVKPLKEGEKVNFDKLQDLMNDL